MNIAASSSIGVLQNKPGPWLQALQFLGAAWLVILLIFWRDAADMALIWWNSSTFNHCLLILPILCWLAFQRKSLLVQLSPQAWRPALLYMGTGALFWLLGNAAGLSVMRHLALIMMLQGAASALLGLNVTRGLLFPLFYMFFLLPVGEEAVPMLQTLTAKMCMTLLGWAGVPAYIDGIFITTPGGYFKVAESCSGVKFLIAMVAYGALVSNLCFKNGGKRAMFMAVCIIVPIIANGLRAFGTIYIAQYQGAEFASGFDHVFYGWIFFGIVIALVMAIGWRYFDKSADAPAFDPAKLQSAQRSYISPKKMLIIVALIVAIPALWSSVVQAQISSVPARIALPQVTGWQVVPYMPRHPWMPKFAGTSHTLIGRYQNASGQEADLYIAVYDRQSDGRELIGFGQGAADTGNKWVWTANIAAPANGKAERITAPGPIARDVVSFFRVNGVTSGSSATIKLATMRTRLLSGNQQAVAILVSSEHNGSQSQRAAIDRFISDLGNVDDLADSMAGLRNMPGLR